MLPRFLTILYTAALFYLLHSFQFESRHFSWAAEIFLSGAVLSWGLPARARPWLMIVAGLVGVFVIFNPAVAAMILLLCSVWILPALLPISSRLRMVLFLFLAVSTLAWRILRPSDPVPAEVVPVIGALFMFRTISFLQHTWSRPELGSLGTRIAYFFLLPNLALYFFPIINYKKFTEQPAGKISPEHIQHGMDWILNGVFQLLLYRWIRSTYYIPMERVHSWGDFVRFIALNFILYLRISGSFHLVAGLINLYGFNLPKTHNKYLFASSFTELWRRVNLYFTGFMSQLVFFPVYFRLKKLGTTRAILAGTGLVFIFSWFFHSYIYLWTTGAFLWRGSDIAFWGLLGSFVLVTTLVEQKSPPTTAGFRSGLAFERWKAYVHHTAKISLFLLVFCFLWSLWTSDNVDDFLVHLSFLRWRGWADFGWLLVFPIVGALGTWDFQREQLARSVQARPVSVWRPREGLNILLIALCVLATWPAMKDRVPHGVRMALERISRADFQVDYEDRIQKRDFYAGIHDASTTAKVDEDDRPLLQQPYVMPLSDFRRWIWRPNVDMIFQKARLVTNEWGMQDRSVRLEKTPGVVRIAVLGSSLSVSYGVNSGLEWPRQAERVLNSELGVKAEILNFSMIDYTTSVFGYDFEQRVLAFRPDIILLEGCARMVLRNAVVLSRAMREGLQVPFPELLSLLEISDVQGYRARHFIGEAPYEMSMATIDWSLSRIGAISRARGIRPVYYMLPLIGTEDDGLVGTEELLVEKASARGFRIADLRRTFGPEEFSANVLGGDVHYNASGHARVGSALARQLVPLVKDVLADRVK